MARPPVIRVAGEHQQLALPGMLWPAGAARAQGNPLFFEEIRPDQANELIDVWGHPLGPCNRPYLSRAWGLAIDGQAVAVAMSASTVGATSAGYKRAQVVELARIAGHPDHRGIMRVMLRLWRDYFAARWDGWDSPVQAAVSYALPADENGKGTGNLYRFDGWKLWGNCKPWSGGATWSNPSKANTMGDGIKKLYYYPVPAVAKDVHALLGQAGFAAGIKPTKRNPGRARPGFRVTSPAPAAARVRYYSLSTDPAAFQLEMLTAYAAAARAAGHAAAVDHDSRELLVTPSPASLAA